MECWGDPSQPPSGPVVEGTAVPGPTSAAGCEGGRRVPGCFLQGGLWPSSCFPGEGALPGAKPDSVVSSFQIHLQVGGQRATLHSLKHPQNLRLGESWSGGTGGKRKLGYSGPIKAPGSNSHMGHNWAGGSLGMKEGGQEGLSRGGGLLESFMSPCPGPAPPSIDTHL